MGALPAEQRPAETTSGGPMLTNPYESLLAFYVDAGRGGLAARDHPRERSDTYR